MNISLIGRGWFCRRNPRHNGKSRSKLIKALLRVSDERARQLAGEHGEVGTPVNGSVSERVRAAVGAASRDEPPERLVWPPEFKPLVNNRVLAQPFINYLRGRDYSDADIEWLAEHYHLHYATRGWHKSRLIIPVYDAMGELKSWTGRTIIPNKQPRYKAPAGHPPGDWLLGLPLLWNCPGPKALLVTEGPTDAMRISVTGHTRGVYGTCLFGLNLSSEQAYQLRELARRFKFIGWLLDEDAELRSFGLQQKSGVRCKRLELPDGVKDPDKLTRKAAVELFQRAGI
jgi:hypothetical protein